MVDDRGSMILKSLIRFVTRGLIFGGLVKIGEDLPISSRISSVLQALKEKYSIDTIYSRGYGYNAFVQSGIANPSVSCKKIIVYKLFIARGYQNSVILLLSHKYYFYNSYI